MSEGADAIRLSPADNVATVLRAVRVGEALRVRCGDAVEQVVAAEAVPLCHKISLLPIGPGAEVVKYGQRIGLTTAAVASGRHVHVHNMRSARGTGPA